MSPSLRRTLKLAFAPFRLPPPSSGQVSRGAMVKFVSDVRHAQDDLSTPSVASFWVRTVVVPEEKCSDRDQLKSIGARVSIDPFLFLPLPSRQLCWWRLTGLKSPDLHFVQPPVGMTKSKISPNKNNSPHDPSSRIAYTVVVSQFSAVYHQVSTGRFRVQAWQDDVQANDHFAS